MPLGIKPTVDVVFKKIFGSPEHARLTLHFLNDILPLAGRPKVESLTILNPFRLAEFRGEKEISVDVRARDESQRDFQIEMQIRADRAPPPRLLDTWARIYSAQIRRGEDFRLHSPVISIWIMEDSLFPEPAWFHRIEPWRDTAGPAPFGDQFLLLVIELEKWRTLPDTDPQAIFGEGIERWLALLAEGEKLDPESREFAALDADIKEAAEIMAGFTRTERARYTYDRRMDWIARVKGWVNGAREDGLKQGLEQGLEQGREQGLRAKALEDARNLKHLGVSLEIIAKATGLSHEEIEQV